MSRLAFRRRAESHPGHRSVAGGLARAAVFGVSDGLVSNVSLVIGFAGAGVDSSVVRLAGLAGAIAGATSMAAGEWVSISAQNELVYRELDVERRELEHNTESETAELAAMYEGHGMTRQTALDAAADVMRVPGGRTRGARPRRARRRSRTTSARRGARPVCRWCASWSARCCRSSRGSAGSGNGAKVASILHRRRRRGTRRLDDRQVRRASAGSGAPPVRS